MPQLIYYCVAGDNYDNIAQKLHQITSQVLEDANHNYPPANLQVGNEIKIPLVSLSWIGISRDLLVAQLKYMFDPTYVIQYGDTYDNIAQRLQQITSQVLEDANPNVPPSFQVGISISIPINNTAIATYVVQKGDTYNNIAQRLQQITSQVLEDANPNYPPDKLQANQINIPLNLY